MMNQYSVGSDGEEAHNKKKGRKWKERRKWKEKKQGQEDKKIKIESLQCAGRVRAGCT